MQPSPIDVANEKSLLRKRALAHRASLSQQERYARDEAICRTILASPAFAACGTLLCYYPVRGEIDLRPVAREALALGKKVAFPISHTDTWTLTFHQIDSISCLSAGAYGIPEPDGSLPTIVNSPDALCLVPALAFDRQGFRLGYGKGYYDRFLAGFGGVAVGAVDSACLWDTLPRHETDRAVGRLFTEKGEFLPHETPKECEQGNLSKQSSSLHEADS